MPRRTEDLVGECLILQLERFGQLAGFEEAQNVERRQLRGMMSAKNVREYMVRIHTERLLCTQSDILPEMLRP